MAIGRPGLSRSRSVKAQQVSWMKSRMAMQMRNMSVLGMLVGLCGGGKCQLERFVQSCIGRERVANASGHGGNRNIKIIS